MPLKWRDAERVRALALRRAAAEEPLARMHVGHIYWTLRETSTGDLCGDAWVWPRADGALDAFAWLDGPELAEVIVAPDADTSMLEEAIAWLEQQSRARGHERIAIVAVESDGTRIEALRQRGYAATNGGNARFYVELRSLPDGVALPSGYALRHVETAEDLVRRAFVESRAFGGDVAADTWRQFQQLPGYRADLDLLVVAPGGDGASAITCWYDAATRCGEIEAVGTVPEHRRLGLCRSLIVEGLRRLHAAGATHVVVQTLISNEPARALYASCGLAPAGIDHAWATSL